MKNVLGRKDYRITYASVKVSNSPYREVVGIKDFTK
jgi:hypothetical protein